MKFFPYSTELRYISVILFGFILIAVGATKERSHPDAYLVPFLDVVQQPDDITCGPTSVAMLVGHYKGLKVSVDEVKNYTRTVWYSKNGNDFGMTAPSFIQEGLKQYGIESIVKQGDLDRLKHFVGMGKPCIVLVRSAEWNWHYVVVVGYGGGIIYFANPASGSVEGLSEKEFYNAWSWSGDIHGRDCSWWIAFLLRSLDVYPRTMIYAL